MITRYGIKCKIEEFAGNMVVLVLIGVPTLALLYVMYLQSGGVPFVEDIWNYLVKIF